MPPIRLAIAGVGNCAWSLLQGITMARQQGEDIRDRLGSLMMPIGGLHVSDIEPVLAFDIDRAKVGQELAKAAATSPNCTTSYIPLTDYGVRVIQGLGLDGAEAQFRLFEPADMAGDATEEGLVRYLIDARAEVLVCYLPVGSLRAVQAYARAAATAKVAFVNATPEPVVHDPVIAALFENVAPLLGDDMKSFIGATTVHTALAGLLEDRGITIDNSYQLNVGGNADFKNMLDPHRSHTKRISKQRALLAANVPESGPTAGPNGYIPHLLDRKVAYIRLEGRATLGMPFSIELRLSVEDSPNTVAVMANAVRIAAAAKRAGCTGIIDEVGAHLFKSPAQGRNEANARESFRCFVEGLSSQEAA